MQEMHHSHCQECNGMIEPYFDRCREDCPALSGYLSNIAHQLVAQPGVLDPPGRCGHCGFPRANRSFYRYRQLVCANGACPNNDIVKFPGGNIFFQAILLGRREEEPLRTCSGCKTPLRLQAVLDDYKPRMDQFKRDAAGNPYLVGVP